MGERDIDKKQISWEKEKDGESRKLLEMWKEKWYYMKFFQIEKKAKKTWMFWLENLFTRSEKNMR